MSLRESVERLSGLLLRGDFPQDMVATELLVMLQMHPEPNVPELQARAYDKGYGHGRHDGERHDPKSLSSTPRPVKGRRNPYRRDRD